MTDEHDPLEQQLRDALRGSEQHADVDAFLGRVHRGARRRRTTRIATGVAAAVCLVVAGGAVVSSSGVLDEEGSAPFAGRTTGTTADTGGPDTTPTDAQTPASTTSGPDFAVEDIATLDVAAVSAEQQWVLGSVPGGDCDARRCPHVFSTTDAGSSWSDLGELPAHPVRGTEDPGSVDGVRFAPDGENGWAYRGALLSTHDGGRTWTRPELPVESNVVGVVVAGDHALATTYNGETAQLLRSPIGTDDWELVPLEEQLGGNPELLSVMDVAASPERAAIVVSYAPDFGGELMVSDDEGGTWVVPPSTDYCQSESRAVGAVSIAAGALWIGCQNRDGRLDVTPVVSTDGGASWQPTGDVFANAGRIAALDDQAALVVEPARPMLGTGGARVFESTLPADGAPAALGVVGDGYATDVTMVDPQTGFLVFDDGAVLRTDDRGRTWAPYGVTSLD